MTGLQLLGFKENINGDAVIGFTSHKEWKASKFVDSTTLSSYFMDADGDQHTKYLGLLNFFATTENVSVPVMRDMFKNAAVLEVEPDQTVTYDLSVTRENKKCMTIADTSTKHQKPGIDETIFEIVLNKEYQKGSFLTYDAERGAQFMVHNDHDPEPFGEGFRHFVVLMDQNKGKWFPNDKLKVGVEYFKMGHVMGEYEVDYDAVDFDGAATGSIRCEFLLGDARGVEAFYTAKAANRKSIGMTKMADSMRNKALNKLESYGGKDGMFIISDKVKGGLSTKGALVGSTLEYLVLAELAKLEAHSLAFARSATITTANGIKRVNEGIYHQQRRGKLIKYARPMGITFNHLHNAVSYIYKNSNIPVTQRVITFRVGSMAHANVVMLFREEFQQQLNAIDGLNLFGTDSKVKGSLISGDINTGLHMNAVVYKSAMIPGIGRIVLELDETLDYAPMTDRFEKGFFGQGMARTSYSMVIEDATDPKYTNVQSAVNGMKLIEGGSEQANIYYIRPEGGGVVYGYEQGRMANEGQTIRVQSSLKQAAKTIWATSSSAALMLDTTRYVTIELQDPTDY